MDIRDFSCFVSDQYFETPLRPPLIEAHIRTKYPEKYTSLSGEDYRFPEEFSWMRIHSWAFNYLYFWCIKPDPSRKGFSTLQRCVAVFGKPGAAALDLSVDTLLLLMKLAFLVDRVATYTTLFLLKSSTTIKPPQMSVTVQYVFFHTLMQFIFFSRSVLRLFLQFHNTLANLISPQADIIAFISNLSFSYSIKDPHNKRESMLDQGKVKYLREHCGWEHVTDDMLKSLDQGHWNFYHFRYFEKEGKISIESTL